MYRREFGLFSSLNFTMEKGVGGGPDFALSVGSENLGGVSYHWMIHIASEHNGSEHVGSKAPGLM